MGVGSTQDEPGAWCSANKQWIAPQHTKHPQWRGCIKGTQEPTARVPSSQSWKNLRIKIHNAVLDYNLKYTINTMSLNWYKYSNKQISGGEEKNIPCRRVPNNSYSYPLSKSTNVHCWNAVCALWLTSKGCSTKRRVTWLYSGEAWQCHSQATRGSTHTDTCW